MYLKKQRSCDKWPRYLKAMSNGTNVVHTIWAALLNYRRNRTIHLAGPRNAFASRLKHARCEDQDIVNGRTVHPFNSSRIFAAKTATSVVLYFIAG